MRKKQPPRNDIQFSYRMHPKLHRQVAKYCRSQRMSMQHFVNTAVAHRIAVLEIES